MSILMVKKILLDGSPCKKCAQAENLLRKRGHWNRIDEVVVAEEGNPDSEGMKLAAEYGVDTAPFFLVDPDEGEKKIYTRVLEFIRSEMPTPPHPQNSDAETVNSRYASIDADGIIADAHREFGAGLTMAFSGAEDVVLIDMAFRNGSLPDVFCLDTGRLHPETYDFLDTVRERYQTDIAVYTPSPHLLEPFVRRKGMNSFYVDGHRECCAIRKVEPLGRALEGRRAWITGLRHDQNPATRSSLAHAETDHAHHDEQGRPLIKINPLIDWDSRQVWDYIRTNNLPYNPLHDRGYRSIGCAPCTRPSRPGEHERMARWWWEDETRRECGLHAKD